jgi:ribulose-5-phosphate 4-epimerase/fuculose-1-phosphate aldolase
MNEANLRAEICRVGRSLFERGYVNGTAGNISARLPGGGGFLITPTDACLGRLEPETLARIDAVGRQLSGAPASKTQVLHRHLYSSDHDAHCVLHTHSTHLVALTLAGVWRADAVLPPITPYQVMKVGRVPLIPYHRPGDAAVGDRLALEIEKARVAGAPIRGVLCERLGPIVWHRDPAQAMAALEELEETAHLWLMTKAEPLSTAQLDELQAHFGARWN